MMDDAADRRRRDEGTTSAGAPFPDEISSQSTTYWLLRIGSVAGIVGALCAAVGNILHPVTPRDDPPALLV
jgi:hypothetical protein